MGDLFSNEVHHVYLGRLDDLLDLCRRLSSIDELVVVLPCSGEIFNVREKGTQINNPIRKDLHKSQLAHLQCISMALPNEYKLPVCGQMRVVSWSWIRHGPGAPGNNFALTAHVRSSTGELAFYKPGIFGACSP